MPNPPEIASNQAVEHALRAGPLTSIDGVMTCRFEHDIDGPGGRLRIVEYVAAEAWPCRRAMWLLPGPIASGEFYAIPHPGFHAAAPLLRAGICCVTVDLLGTGASSRPADGRTANLAAQTAAVAEAIAHYRRVRGIDRVDVLGESWGGAIASQLAADPERVRSCVIVSAVYRVPTPALDAAARDPRHRAGLDAIPDGYVPIGLEIWGPLLGPCPAPVREWAIGSQLGLYPAAPLYAVLDLPYFDPSVARVPGLVIRGSEDPMVGADDSAELAERYGGGAELRTIAGAGHLPRVEDGSREGFWATVLEFDASVEGMIG